MGVFSQDDFSGVAGDINGDSLSGGGTWTHHGSSDLNSGSFQSNSGKVYQNGSGADCGYYTSGAPATADYDVEIDVSSASVDANLGSSGLGVMGRVSTSAATGYIAYVDRTTVYIYKIVAGSYTSLGSASWSPSSSTTYRLTLEMRGTALKAYIDGVQKVSVTDSSVTSAGKAGIYGYSLYAGVFTNSWMGDNFAATDAPVSVSPAPPGLTATITLPAPVVGVGTTVTTPTLDTAVTLPAPAVSTTAGATVSSPPLAGAVDFLTPAISIAGSATVFGVPLTGTVTLPAPAVAIDPGVRAAPGWIGTFVLVDRNPTPTPTAATMTLTLRAPTVTTTSGGASVTVTGVPLAGAVAFLAPAVSTSDNTGVAVTAAPLAGTVDLLAPVITTSSGPTGTNVTVFSPGLTGTLALVAPTVSATVEGAIVAPPPMAMALSLSAPTVRITPDTPVERVHRARRYGRRRNWS